MLQNNCESFYGFIPYRKSKGVFDVNKSSTAFRDRKISCENKLISREFVNQQIFRHRFVQAGCVGRKGNIMGK